MSDVKYLVPHKFQQSPIDFGRAEPYECVFPSNYIAINWNSDLEGHIEAGDASVKYIFNNTTSGNGLYLSGDFFPLDQMHFHAPSEHKINGAGAEVEVHIVHMQPAPKPENDQYVVLGIWVNAGDGKESVNRFFADLTERLKAGKEAREAAKLSVSLNPNDLLPPCQDEFWRYEGSLTTKLREDNPECARWVVYRRPLLVAPEILKGFIEVGHHAKTIQPLNRRSIQPLNRRFVLASIPAPVNGD